MDYTQWKETATVSDTSNLFEGSLVFQPNNTNVQYRYVNKFEH